MNRNGEVNRQPNRNWGLTRIFRTWSVLLLCGLLAACSTTRFAYNQLDWIIVWYLNGYFSLDEAQEEQLRDAVVRNVEWHRRTQLPKYAEYLRQLERDAAGPVSPETLEQRFEQAIEFWDAALDHMLPDVSAFFLTFSDEQVDEFVANLEDNNQELWDEYAGETPERRMERREKAAFKGFKRMVGRLNDDQKQLVRSYLANMHDVSEYWIESRRQWQRDFRDLIKERPAEPVFTERLTSLMLDPNRTDDPAYRVDVDENRRIFIEMTAALSTILTDKQRERFAKLVSGFARDFEILSVQES